MHSSFLSSAKCPHPLFFFSCFTAAVIPPSSGGGMFWTWSEAGPCERIAIKWLKLRDKGAKRRGKKCWSRSSSGLWPGRFNSWSLLTVTQFWGGHGSRGTELSLCFASDLHWLRGWVRASCVFPERFYPKTVFCVFWFLPEDHVFLTLQHFVLNACRQPLG